MKILLVLPASESLRVTHENKTVPNRAMLRFSVLSLLAVAGITPKKHEVQICDENVQPLDMDTDADLVGISFMTALADRAYEIAHTFREQGKIVVAGGYHPTLNTEDALPHFDAVVMGNAEEAWPRLLEDLEAGRLKEIYENEKPCSLEDLPLPRLDLIKETAHHYVTTNAVQVGRGCSHRCTYCSITAFHNGTFRAGPLDQVMEALRLSPLRLQARPHDAEGDSGRCGLALWTILPDGPHNSAFPAGALHGRVGSRLPDLEAQHDLSVRQQAGIDPGPESCFTERLEDRRGHSFTLAVPLCR